MAFPTPTDLDALEAQIKALSKALKEYRELATKMEEDKPPAGSKPTSPKAMAEGSKTKPKPTPEQQADSWNTVTQASSALSQQFQAFPATLAAQDDRRAAPPGDTPQLQSDFSSFIHSVGLSLSRAQDALDLQARKALLDQPDPASPLLPALYRIPKLSAEVKFAFGAKSEEGLNLLFFSKKDQASQEHQQSIAFDIVATPPPPELLDRLLKAAPRIQLVLAPSVRRTVLKAIQGIQEQRGELSAARIRQLELDYLPGPGPEAPHEDRLLIIQVPGPTATRFLLFAASDSTGKDSAHEVGAWHLDLTTPGKPRLKAVISFSSDDETGEHQGFLKEFVLELGKRQADFLQGLGVASDSAAVS